MRFEVFLPLHYLQQLIFPQNNLLFHVSLLLAFYPLDFLNNLSSLNTLLLFPCTLTLLKFLSLFLTFINIYYFYFFRHLILASNFQFILLYIFIYILQLFR